MTTIKITSSEQVSLAISARKQYVRGIITQVEFFVRISEIFKVESIKDTQDIMTLTDSIAATMRLMDAVVNK